MNNDSDQTERFGYTQREYVIFRRYGWRFLLLFSFLYCSMYCVRLNLAAASPVLMAQLGLTKGQLGLLTGVLFWTYGIGQLVNGRLSECVGPDRFILASAIGSICASVLMGLQSRFGPMAAIWAVNGYAQSMAWTSGVAIITRWWPGKMRGFASGFAYAFSGFGQALMTLSVTFALANFRSLGWRAAFIVPAAFPAFFLLLYVLFARTKPQKVGLRAYAEDNEDRRKSEEQMRRIVESKGPLYPYRYLLSDRHYIPWLLVVFMAGVARYGLSTWIPLFFVEKYGVDIINGLMQSLALPMGMGVGTLIVPSLTDRYCPDNRFAAVALSALVAGVAVILFVMLDPRVLWQLVLIEALLFVSGFCIYAIGGTSVVYATDIGGRVFSGTAAGGLSFAAYMGAAIQSVVYGLALKYLGWNFVFYSISALCALSFIISAVDCRRGH